MAGCGTAAHNAALEQAKSWSVAHGDIGRVTCSSGIGGFRPQVRTPDFICLIRHTESNCDELRVHRIAGVWHVSVYRRHVDCVVPL